jgi:Lrp/AsnC family transcriptional regulator, leucine-responsive regulatory protein
MFDMVLDDMDRAILAELQRDGRMTNAELASTIGLSPSAALRRTRALERSGVIDGYVALVDAKTVGRGTTVFVEITLDNQSEANLDRFEAAIARCPEVAACHLMAGDADYLVQVICADVEDFERVHRDWLSKLPGLARLRSSFALRAVCRRTALEL